MHSNLYTVVIKLAIKECHSDSGAVGRMLAWLGSSPGPEHFGGQFRDVLMLQAAKGLSRSGVVASVMFPSRFQGRIQAVRNCHRLTKWLHSSIGRVPNRRGPGFVYVCRSHVIRSEMGPLTCSLLNDISVTRQICLSVDLIIMKKVWQNENCILVPYENCLPQCQS